MKKWLASKIRMSGLTTDEIRERTGASSDLVRRLINDEGDGGVTHPNIAARLARELRLSIDEYNVLVHEEHRTRVIPKPVPLPDMDGYRRLIRFIKGGKK